MLLPEGITKAANLIIEASLPSRLLKAPKTVDSFCCLLADYALFTPALVYLTTPFDVDPFVMYAQETGISLPLEKFTNGKACFGNLYSTTVTSKENWNTVLYALPKEFWPSFCNWFATCAFRTADGRLRRVRTQEIALHDSGCESVPVVAFTVETNEGSFYLQKKESIFVARFDTELKYNDTILLADAVNREEPNPYFFVQANMEIV